MSERELQELAEIEQVDQVATVENDPWKPWHTTPGTMTYKDLINGEWYKIWKASNADKLARIQVTEF